MVVVVGENEGEKRSSGGQQDQNIFKNISLHQLTREQARVRHVRVGQIDGRGSASIESSSVVVNRGRPQLPEYGAKATTSTASTSRAPIAADSHHLLIMLWSVCCC